jgi:hypothetical protein
VAETVIGNDRRTESDTDSYPYTISNADHDTCSHTQCHTNGDAYRNANRNSESYTDSDVYAVYAYAYADPNRYSNVYTKAYTDPETSTGATPSPDSTALKRVRSAPLTNE